MKTIFYLVLTLGMLISACSPVQAIETPAPLPQLTENLNNNISSTPVPAEETNLPTCATTEINHLAETIAADYTFTTSEEVLIWFCNGAEFEDIGLALASEEASGVPAEDMLALLAQGFTWDEVWLTIGFTK